MADVGVEKNPGFKETFDTSCDEKVTAFFFFNINCCRSRCLMATFHVVKIILVTLRE